VAWAFSWGAGCRRASRRDTPFGIRSSRQCVGSMCDFCGNTPSRPSSPRRPPRTACSSGGGWVVAWASSWASAYRRASRRGTPCGTRCICHFYRSKRARRRNTRSRRNTPRRRPRTASPSAEASASWSACERDVEATQLGLLSQDTSTRVEEWTPQRCRGVAQSQPSGQALRQIDTSSDFSKHVRSLSQHANVSEHSSPPGAHCRSVGRGVGLTGLGVGRGVGSHFQPSGQSLRQNDASSFFS